MYCENCGNKLEADALFCQSCGKRVIAEGKGIVVEESGKPTSNFYSKEWQISNSFAFVSLPRVDVAIGREHFYLIRLPSYGYSNIGGLIGFVFLSLLGAIIGSSIGESIDLKKREKFRSAWVDSNGKIVSKEYVPNIYKQIRLVDLKDSVSFGKTKIYLNINGKKITLRRPRKSFRVSSPIEVNRIKNELEKHVL